MHLTYRLVPHASPSNVADWGTTLPITGTVDFGTLYSFVEGGEGEGEAKAASFWMVLV